MKNLFILSLILFLSSSANAIHFFDGTYREALQKAKNENKNIFISFTASWCGPCRLMKKIVFENEKVTKYTDEHYISLLLNIEFKPYMLLQQRINPQRAGGIPHICIITPEEELLKENSTVNVHQMMKFLKITDNAKPIRRLLTAEELPPTQESPRLFENRTQYESILTSAREENKNMLLCFSSHFCAPCRHMESTTFRNPAIIEATNRQYITGYFETGDPKDQTLCHRYRNAQTVIPYLVIATPDEKIIRKRTGYMEELAACCNLSPNYFHTLFYKTFSTTPHAYMMRLKMNEATTLIINSELTMKEIAFRLGFLNDTYFSHVFKKYYHTTPGSFRKEFRNISFI